MKGLALSDKDRRRQTESRDPLKNVELSDAVERQIRALPRGCRQVAQLLKFYSPDEVAIRLGWSKRKVKKIIALISQHFAAVEWDEIDLRRIKKFPNCIVNTGEEEISKPNHPSHEKDEL